MQGYGKSFARVYNLMWTHFADRVGPKILDYYRTTAPGRAMRPVLDLCCGVGTAGLHFLAAGYRVVGLDASEHMLEIARDNAREFVDSGKAAFIQADAARFEAGESFGLVMSTFNAMNHLAGEDELRSCFGRVLESLEPGGLFIFDLNTRFHLQHFDGIEVEDTEQVMLVRRGAWDEENGRAFIRLTGFLKDDDGRYSRFSEFVEERAYELSEVAGRLEKVGFHEVRVTGEDDLAGRSNEMESTHSAFFVAAR